MRLSSGWGERLISIVSPELRNSQAFDTWVFPTIIRIHRKDGQKQISIHSHLPSPQIPDFVRQCACKRIGSLRSILFKMVQPPQPLLNPCRDIVIGDFHGDAFQAYAGTKAGGKVCGVDALHRFGVVDVGERNKHRIVTLRNIGGRTDAITR